MKGKWILIIISSCLVACSQAPPIDAPLPIYQGLSKIPLDVGVIRYQGLPQPTPELAAPLLLTPEEAVQNWMAARLQSSARDGAGVAIVTLVKHELTEELLESTFFSRWFNPQIEQLNGKLTLIIEFYDDRNKRFGQVKSAVTQIYPFDHEINLRERQTGWRALILDLINLLDLDIREKLQAFTVKKAT